MWEIEILNIEALKLETFTLGILESWNLAILKLWNFETVKLINRLLMVDGPWLMAQGSWLMP